MEKVRMGVIGTGGMGQGHLGYFGGIENLELTAVCDTNPETLAKVSEKYPQAKAYDDHRKLLADGACDGVIIATPHYDHMPITIDCFKKGVHVLCEKPMAVYTKAAKEGVAFHKQHASQLVFTVMFMSRTYKVWQKAKEIIASGQLGELRRVSWIVTSWFRSQSYYDSGGWRATWGGEGGGVLLNQCPHNLDLITWLCGLPKRVTANVGIGKFHRIEVEDEVNALLEYENGATGQFVTTTGEAPGTDRLEIVGDNGKMVVEGSKIQLFKTECSVQEFSDTTQHAFALPKCEVTDVEIEKQFSFGHADITQNFLNAIQHDEPLIVEPEGAIRGLALGNAILMSGLQKRPVDVPFDDDEYKAMIEDLAAKSTFKKEVKSLGDSDLSASFH